MIQRIQSVYLLLTTIFSILFLSGDIIKFFSDAGSSFVIDFNGLSRISDETGLTQIEMLLPLVILLLLVPLISFVTIFLYKKRRLQMRFAIGLISIIVLLLPILGFYSLEAVRDFSVRIVPGIGLIFPFLMLITSILAYLGIRKDEKIVKSYERMR